MLRSFVFNTNICKIIVIFSTLLLILSNNKNTAFAEEDTSADDHSYRPKVTKLESDAGFGTGIQFFDHSSFDDSNNLVKIHQNRLYLSKDNGYTWNLIKDIDYDKFTPVYITTDLSHKDRAFLSVDPLSQDEKENANPNKGVSLYYTENKGEKWERIYIEDVQSAFFSSSHPTNMDYLIFWAVTCETVVDEQQNARYPDCSSSHIATEDRGKTWNVIGNVLDEMEKQSADDTNNQLEKYNVYDYCEFARSGSADSQIMDPFDIVCLRSYYPSASTHHDADEDTDYIPRKNSKLYFSKTWGKSFELLNPFQDLAVTEFFLNGKYMIVFTARDAYNRFSKGNVYISLDGINFKEAQFPTDINSAFSYVYDVIGSTIIISSSIIKDKNNNRIKDDDNVSFDDVLFFNEEQIFLSDSTGLKFEKLENLAGYISSDNKDSVVEPDFLYMFSAFQGLEGTFFSTASRIEHDKFPQVYSKITLDYGRSWRNLRVNKTDNDPNEYVCDVNDYEHCSLNSGFIFSVDGSYEMNLGRTPGLLALTGSVSPSIDSSQGNNINYEDLDVHTFVSTDGGLTWKFALGVSSIVAYGDLGNIMVAVPYSPNEDGDPNSEFYYSLDHGNTWTEYQLDEEFFAISLNAVVLDGSGYHFILDGFYHGNNPNDPPSNFKYLIDFSRAFGGKTCFYERDTEDWVQANGECINGVRNTFRRRKPNSPCLVRRIFEGVHHESQICDCTAKDYECAKNFRISADGTTCEPDYSMLLSDGVCSNSKNGELELESKQLITDTQCKKPKNKFKEKTKVVCNDLNGDTDNDAEVSIVEKSFDEEFLIYEYFGSVKDDSLLIQTRSNKVFVSLDGGISFKQVETGGEGIVEVVFNKYNDSCAYLFGEASSIFITENRGHSFFKSSIPKDSREILYPLDFSYSNSQEFIYYGGKNCRSFFDPNCHTIAYITKDGGRTFEQLLEYAGHCDFVGSFYHHPVDENMIICEVKENGMFSKSIYSSTDYFQKNKVKLFDNCLGFITNTDYTIFAILKEDNALSAFVTVDGKEIAEAKFPKNNLQLDKQEAFTVLGSSLGSLFIHLTTHVNAKEEFGALLKSNSNGTSFVTLERAVNRNEDGFVDFEYINGLEGIIITNVVSNADSIKKKTPNGDSVAKILRSKITFNDGGDWRYIQPPKKDSNNKAYDKCSGKNLEKCSLNLHGFTERKDIRDTFSSGSAIGMLLGVGNVGDSLLPMEECSTFMTVDGGVTWKEVKKGPYQWEFGDRGSVIVLVKDGSKTSSITYSVDSGKTWKDYIFSEEEILITDIVTHPKDCSMKFILIGEKVLANGKQTITYTIDFSRAFSRQCKYDTTNPDTDDYEYFSITHPDAKTCLFGHEAEYLRKNKDDCYVGMAPIEDNFRIVKNCSCTRDDFECDYNFYRASDGTCKLVEGLSPADPQEVCMDNPDMIEFFKSTGYRKIPLSTCVGGKELDKSTTVSPCPGKEKEFKAKHSMGMFERLFLIVLPLFVLIFATWFVYDRGIKRNGGFSRFGEIRLGDDDDLVEENRTDVVVNNILRCGIFAFNIGANVFQLIKKSLGGGFSRFVELMRGGNRSRGPSYTSLTTDQFLDEADDLLSGHDDDANDLSSFNSNDVNFDIDDHHGGSENSSVAASTEEPNFTAYTDNVENDGGDAATDSNL
ncbi:type I sorting receptor SCDLUD_001587 [Saccharomycodes ludwigii]|uniref:type I sorting receptor n=1 Tax=Saccharomycodes ludwigii TaxID=36035 RepID=UPI001E87F1A8|nr:hypothetical protein SCDLUD_001587 [Saccharomycodes ludwigii]KAH3901805.1 hypothetical protein SCDLUD_001587 [Saccharomycodes ludwigii]